MMYNKVILTKKYKKCKIIFIIHIYYIFFLRHNAYIKYLEVENKRIRSTKLSS